MKTWYKFYKNGQRTSKEIKRIKTEERAIETTTWRTGTKVEANRNCNTFPWRVKGATRPIKSKKDFPQKKRPHWRDGRRSVQKT